MSEEYALHASMNSTAFYCLWIISSGLNQRLSCPFFFGAAKSGSRSKHAWKKWATWKPGRRETDNLSGEFEGNHEEGKDEGKNEEGKGKKMEKMRR